MLSLVESLPGTRIRIFSGLEPNGVRAALLMAAEGEEGVDNKFGDSGSRGDTGVGEQGRGVGTVISAVSGSAAS